MDSPATAPDLPESPNIPAPYIPATTDIAIIGAGPQALTLVAHLLQKRQAMRGRFVVLDPSGTWMQQWQQQFAAQDIPHLRSPVVHHPDPNPGALRAFATRRGNELFAPYDLPGTQLFGDFCQQLVQQQQLQDRVLPAQVERIEPILRGDRPPYRPPYRPRFRLWLAGGGSLIARRVVLATGGGAPQLPPWAMQSPHPPERLCHSHQVDLRRCQLAGERVVIVGGGLTSGHLALGALARGAAVRLIVRRPLQEKLFDADAGWLGPKYLKGFAAEPDARKRWAMIQQARDGGSVTPAVRLVLRRLQRQGQLTLMESCQIREAHWQGGHWNLRCDSGDQLQADRLWLATGTQLDASTHPLLQDVLAAYPGELVQGLPVLDAHLRWRGCELYCMGGLASLQVGPVARNLSGARMASNRIAAALTKSSLAL